MPERETQKDADESNSSELPMRRQRDRMLEHVRPLRLKGMWVEPPVLEGASTTIFSEAERVPAAASRKVERLSAWPRESVAGGKLAEHQ